MGMAKESWVNPRMTIATQEHKPAKASRHEADDINIHLTGVLITISWLPLQPLLHAQLP